jgi:hypothetical protein
MPMYLVTKTETVTVHATDEEHAEHVANEQFNELPDATYAVECITPQHRLREIEQALLNISVACYYDDFRNNIHDFLRVSLTAMHPDDADAGDVFYFQCELDENEEFNGLRYELFDENYTLLEAFPATLSPLVIANIARRALQRYAFEAGAKA